MSRSLYTLGLIASLAVAPSIALSQQVEKTALPINHPLVGTWKIELRSVKCFEIYDVRADGTTRVTSGEQAAESEFELALTPSERGFYKWVDKITKDNGKPDCMGSVMEVGHVATNFIAVHPSGRAFLMCEKEDLNTCIGPFVRQAGT